MFENNPEEVDQIVQKAKAEDENAKNATEIVNDAISKMNPQRNQEDKSQNHR
ncbi:hypothetical protein [Alkalihalobacillus deserti]|uniref:hypothetical protein n=1 Tax=Alkalihalobacillus deserti TaxID=2879466 RepID=UPI001D15717F|nr:hypothetical protein [Alkalihalobacillus deserti]